MTQNIANIAANSAAIPANAAEIASLGESVDILRSVSQQLSQLLACLLRLATVGAAQSVRAVLMESLL